MCTRIAWAGVRPDFAKPYTEFCAQETGLGVPAHKFAKQMTKVKGALRDMKGRKSVGVVEDDKEKGIMKIAKPVGVIGALLPVTNGEATPFVKALFAIKTRNAIIMAPHPKAQKTNDKAMAQIRGVLKKHGWPEDLVIGIEGITLDKSKELIKQVDLILATGGGPMVKAAYSSGKPAHGVGAGNAMIIVDETADLKDAADKIMRSKTFDHATSCSTENSLAIQEGIYDKMIKELEAVGGYLCNAEEKAKLQKGMWDEKGALNREIVAQSAEKIAKVAGINLPKGKSFLMVEETGIGKGFPFSAEKLSVTMTLYKYKEFARRHRPGQPHHLPLRPGPLLRHPHGQRDAHPGAVPQGEGVPHHGAPAAVPGQQRGLDQRHAHVHDPGLRHLGRQLHLLQRDLGAPAELHLGILPHPQHPAVGRGAVRQRDVRGLIPCRG